MTTSQTKREREGRCERRLLFSKMVEGAEHRAEKKQTMQTQRITPYFLRSVV
jgi:hypothetical protein